MNDIILLAVYITCLVILIIEVIIWAYLHFANQRGEKIIREMYEDRKFLEEHCPRIFHKDAFDETFEEYCIRKGLIIANNVQKTDTDCRNYRR